MEFYKYDSDNIYCGVVPGTWDPLAKKLKAPGSSTNIKPPEIPEKMIPRWQDGAWELIPDIYAEQAEFEANMQKLRNSDELGIALFKMDVYGKVVPKTETELKHDRNLYKKALAQQHISEVLQLDLMYIVKKLSGADPALVKYMNEITDIYKNVDADTEIESIEWPQLS